jgi:hypothetical protein
VSIEQTPGGVVLRDEVAGTAGVSVDLLRFIELRAAGDTRVRIEDGRIVLTRFLAAPDGAAVHDAAAALAKTAAQVRDVAAATESVSNAMERATPPAPRFPPSPDLAQLAARYRTVAVTQSVWAQPDPATAPTGTLEPGVWYEVLERRGDWAHLFGEDLPACWTDARTLIDVLQGDEP